MVPIIDGITLISHTLVVVQPVMKSTKVQTLGAVALHGTTAYTDEASIVGLL